MIYLLVSTQESKVAVVIHKRYHRQGKIFNFLLSEPVGSDQKTVQLLGRRHLDNRWRQLDGYCLISDWGCRKRKITAFESSFLPKTKLNLHQMTSDLHTDCLPACSRSPELEPEPEPKSCPWWRHFNRRDLWVKGNKIDLNLCCWFEASSEGHTLVSPFSLMNIQHFVFIICCWRSNHSEDCGCLLGGARSSTGNHATCDDEGKTCRVQSPALSTQTAASLYSELLFCHFI